MRNWCLIIENGTSYEEGMHNNTRLEYNDNGSYERMHNDRKGPPCDGAPSNKKEGFIVKTLHSDRKGGSYEEGV